jgi:Uma2 family endonuclease
MLQNSELTQMSTVSKPYISPDEYLAIERRSDTKHEYYAGEMFAMAGATEEHNLIAGNVFASLHLQLKGRPDKIFLSDMRVKVVATGLRTYPDVVALCGETEFEDGVRDTLTNPSLLVEVLSESTESYDRGKKFEHYRKIPSFREYLLIAQDRVHIERYLRSDDGQWVLLEYGDLASTIELSSIGGTLQIADVYDKVPLTAKAKDDSL